MNHKTKLDPAPLAFPNGGALSFIKTTKIARAKAEEAAKQQKKSSNSGKSK